MEEKKLPKGWVWTTINEINFRKSENVKPQDFPDTKFESYSVPIFPTKKPEIVFGKEIKSSKQVVYGDEVLLCKINPRINRVWIVGNFSENKKIASSEWIIVDTKKEIPSNFLRYLFSAPFFRTLLQSEVSGVGGSLTRARPKIVNDYKFPLPPLPEQKRITAKLDKLFGHLEVLRARLAAVPGLLADFRQSVLTQAVTGKLTEESTTLGDLGITIQTGPFGSALHKHDYIEDGISVINPSHIRNGKIFPSPKVSVNEKKFQELVRWKLEDGDVIVGRRGEMGRAAKYDTSFGKLLCGTGSIVFKSHPDIDADFLVLFLRSSFTINYLTKNSVGSTMVNLNQKIIRTLPYPKVKKREQTQIVARVQSLFAKADRIEARYQALKEKIETLPQAILAKAFRGELTEQLATDGDARDLLAEIAKLRAEMKGRKKKK